LLTLIYEINLFPQQELVRATLRELGYSKIIVSETVQAETDCIRKVDKDEKCPQVCQERVESIDKEEDLAQVAKLFPKLIVVIVEKWLRIGFQKFSRKFI